MIVADLITLLKRFNPERPVFIKSGDNEAGILAQELAELRIVQGTEGREVLVLFPSMPQPQQSTPDEVNAELEKAKPPKKRK